MAKFKYFKSTVTGKTGRYPAHYASRESFVEIDPETAECIDCGQKDDVVDPEPSEDYVYVDYYESKDA